MQKIQQKMNNNILEEGRRPMGTPFLGRKNNCLKMLQYRANINLKNMQHNINISLEKLKYE